MSLDFFFDCPSILQKKSTVQSVSISTGRIENLLLHLIVTYITSDACLRDNCAAAEVAKFPFIVNTKENVLWFDVSMSDRWLLDVHMEQTLDNVRGDQEHFALLQAFLALVCPRLNQVE